jgi:hypothetical protein
MEENGEDEDEKEIFTFVPNFVFVIFVLFFSLRRPPKCYKLQAHKTWDPPLYALIHRHQGVKA